MGKLLKKSLNLVPTPYIKAIGYNLRNNNSARILINTEHFKNTFINRLTYRHNLNL